MLWTLKCVIIFVKKCNIKQVFLVVMTVQDYVLGWHIILNKLKVNKYYYEKTKCQMKQKRRGLVWLAFCNCLSGCGWEILINVLGRRRKSSDYRSPLYNPGICSAKRMSYLCWLASCDLKTSRRHFTILTTKSFYLTKFINVHPLTH